MALNAHIQSYEVPVAWTLCFINEETEAQRHHMALNPVLPHVLVYLASLFAHLQFHSRLCQ